ncbi:unannotated protein [freshwater metagenome]|uniref:Unannotated protein n=1 Tax=freshwater metagenome TaxID=449393 RepID=A0A6J6MNT1_9ZZZZ
MHTDGLLLLVNFIINVWLKKVCDASKLGVPAGGLICRAADDQRRASLVNQDGVNFVDHRKVVTALHKLLTAPRHVVAQVVEPEFIIGAIGDVTVVLDSTLSWSHVRKNHADV